MSVTRQVAHSLRNDHPLIVEALLDPSHDRTEIAVDEIEEWIKARGQSPSRQAILDLLRELEKLGFGKLKIGRRNHKTRFIWKVDRTSLSNAMASASVETPPSAVTSRSADMIKHSYRLRPDLVVDLDLPTNLSTSEAIRLAEFIKTLPFD